MVSMLKAYSTAPHNRLAREYSGIANRVKRLVICWHYVRSLLA